MKIVNNKRGFTLPALVYIVAGLILLICPEITTKTITYSVGVIFMVLGVAEVISYLRLEPDLASHSTGFTNGILTALIGLFIFVKSEDVMKIIPVILGFLIIVSGTFKLQHALNLYRIKVDGYKGVLIIGAINILIGIITVMNPFKTVTFLMRIMGIGLIISGVTDLGSVAYMNKEFKRYSKDIEHKCIEEKK